MGDRDETAELIDMVTDMYHKLRQMVKEREFSPPQYVIQIRPDIYDMIDKLAQINEITWEEAWFRLLNNEFKGIKGN